MPAEVLTKIMPLRFAVVAFIAPTSFRVAPIARGCAYISGIRANAQAALSVRRNSFLFSRLRITGDFRDFRNSLCFRVFSENCGISS
jgi:hypothetical protein